MVSMPLYRFYLLTAGGHIELRREADSDRDALPSPQQQRSSGGIPRSKSGMKSVELRGEQPKTSISPREKMPVWLE